MVLSRSCPERRQATSPPAKAENQNLPSGRFCLNRETPGNDLSIVARPVLFKRQEIYQSPQPKTL
jgi:hypothetical protein